MAKEIQSAKVVFSKVCSTCQSRLSKHEPNGLCCMNGKVRIDQLDPPEEIKNLLKGDSELSKTYKKFSRLFNIMFQFTQFKAEEISMEEAKPAMKILGQIYRLMKPM